MNCAADRQLSLSDFRMRPRTLSESGAAMIKLREGIREYGTEI